MKVKGAFLLFNPIQKTFPAGKKYLLVKIALKPLCLSSVQVPDNQ